MTEGSEDRPLLSHWRRLVGILFEPRRVMEDLARQPRWILPVVLGSVSSVVIGLSVGVQALLDSQIDPWELVVFVFESTFLRLVLTFVAHIAFLFVVAFALAGLVRALGFPLGTRHARAIVSYSLVPGVLTSLANDVFRAGVASLQLEFSLPQWFWLNAAAFLERSTSHPLVYSFFVQIGVYPLWGWLLVALGLTIVLRSVSFRVALGAAVVASVLVGWIWHIGWTFVARLIESNLP